jgi:small subunit ribosomal protein S20
MCGLWARRTRARIAQDSPRLTAARGGIAVAKRIKSGLKDLRRSAKRRTANVAVKSRIKTLVRAAAEQPKVVVEAQTALDKAAARGIIHPNTAARRKSRMMRRTAAKAG